MEEVIDGIEIAMESNVGDALHFKVSTLKQRGLIDLPTTSIGRCLEDLAEDRDSDYEVEKHEGSKTTWTVKEP